MSGTDPRAPVIVGAGQIAAAGDEPMTPLELMSAAARVALEDSGAAALGARVQSVAATHCFSWPVPDPAAALVAELGLEPEETVRSNLAGTSPIDLLRDAAARIAAGELDVALLAGGEAARSLARGAFDGGPAQPDGTEPTRLVGSDREAWHPAEQAAGLYLPIAYYPLFEHALRAARGEGLDEHRERIARLWARFAEVAADNPYAAVRDAPDAATIATASERNRPIASPYTKLMTANLQVDQGAAIVLCSSEAADAAGIPADRRIFVAATAAATDHWFTIERDRLDRSPAIAACAGAALGHAGADIDDVGLIDLYSCFPSAVQIAANELGLDLERDSRPPTVTGGLTFAGGPASNYPMHSLATLSDALRDQGGLGLATGVGWFMTKHALALLSADPPSRPFGDFSPQAEVDALPRREPGAGEGEIETYTVLFDRDAQPTSGIVSSIGPDGSRSLAARHDQVEIAELLDGDPLAVTTG